MRRVAAAMLLALSLAGCGGGGGSKPPAQPVDETLERSWRVAQLAYAQGRYDQAAQLYRAALERAWARDDVTTAADLGYELAVTELRRGDAAAALAAARAARAELARRGAAPFPALDLAEAAALYRTGDARGAEALAGAVAANPAASPAARERARFVLGEIAADARDRPRLAAAIAALDGVGGPEAGADRAELTGRLATLDGDEPKAAERFAAAADLRRETLDYPGMARALALAAGARESAGQRAEAAQLYLRAGRSATFAGGAGSPRAWLTRAVELARATAQPALAAEASALIDRLPAAP